MKHISQFLILTTLLLASCVPVRVIAASGSDSRQIQTPTPIVGIAIQELKGNYGFEVSNEIKNQLEKIGFNVYFTWEYAYEDKVEIQIDGFSDQFVSLNRTYLNRVAEASVRVKDLRTDKVVLSVIQGKTNFALSAPRIEDFSRLVATEISKYYTPLNSVC